MRKFSLIIALIALVGVVTLTTGCDDRSQLEKDADKAASKLKKAVN